MFKGDLEHPVVLLDKENLYCSCISIIRGHKITLKQSKNLDISGKKSMRSETSRAIPAIFTTQGSFYP